MRIHIRSSICVLNFMLPRTRTKFCRSYPHLIKGSGGSFYKVKEADMPHCRLMCYRIQDRVRRYKGQNKYSTGD